MLTVADFSGGRGQTMCGAAGCKIVEGKCNLEVVESKVHRFSLVLLKKKLIDSSDTFFLHCSVMSFTVVTNVLAVPR